MLERASTIHMAVPKCLVKFCHMPYGRNRVQYDNSMEGMVQTHS